MAGEIQIGGTTFATESGGTVTVSNVDNATNRQNLGLEIGVDVQQFDADTTKNDVANTFTANQIISVTDNTNAALRVTQLGTGNALVVEDSANPDSTPFVVDATGNLLVGTTSQLFADKFNVTANGASQYSVFHNTDTTTAQQFSVVFARDGATVGSINTTNTSTSYVTSSDYRLKEDWQPMSGSINRLKNLNPVNFAWQADGIRVDGFLAHEIQGIVPEAVSGEKDAVDSDGKPEYQGVDYGRITPLLTAALKEAIEKIEMLEARIAVLEEK